MPRLSDTMQEGTLARWLKQPGEHIERGEIVAEIETDKATMELEAYDSGVLEKILVEAGQTVPIGQPIAVVGSGEATEQATDQPTGQAAPAADKPAADKPAAESTGDVSAETTGASAPAAPPPPDEARRAASPSAQAQPEQTPRHEPATAERDGDEIKASPMARAIARERGIDLHTIHGSGPGGRIIRADVEAAAPTDGAKPAPAPAAAQPAPPQPAAAAAAASGPRPGLAAEDVEELPLTNIRRVVARRMVESVQSAPHFYLTSVVDAEAMVRFRAELNERLASGDGGMKISLNDLLVKACAVALREHPDVNVSFAGDKILRYRRIHIGIAVALEGGLIVPVIRDVDRKSLGEIGREAHALIERARAGRLTPDDYSGGTFTISNLGMFGIDHFTAVINPPEAAILAVGATRAEPVVRDGQVAVHQTMKLTLSIDHRALDGATAARFLQRLTTILEEPLRIVV
jgi:pyruvate dehydrogenase E2 component (dihydrolipoamide acetyltransferase)